MHYSQYCHGWAVYYKYGQALLVIIVEKFFLKIPRVAGKIERFYINIVQGTDRFILNICSLFFCVKKIENIISRCTFFQKNIKIQIQNCLLYLYYKNIKRYYSKALKKKKLADLINISQNSC